MSGVSVSNGFKERHVLCMPFQKFEHFLKAFCKTVFKGLHRTDCFIRWSIDLHNFKLFVRLQPDQPDWFHWPC